MPKRRKDAAEHARAREKQAPHVLVVEDSPTQAEALAAALRDAGYRVTVAPNGDAALELLDEGVFDIVISDIVMPGAVDGYELCRRLKAGRHHDTPVVLLTSLSDPMDIIRGLEAGADNFLTKPCEPSVLLERLEVLLATQRVRAGARVKAGVVVQFLGRQFTITSEREQILDLLVSTFEDAVRQNARLRQREAELARSHQSLRGLYDLAVGLNEANTEAALLETALDTALAFPGVQAGWIVLREDAGGFRLAAARNLPPALEGPGVFQGDCLCRRRLLSGELASVEILECERLQRARGDVAGLRYHASIPLWLGDRTVGVMNLVGAEEGLFDDDDLKVLYGVGNQIAVALGRADLQAGLEALVERRTAALTAEIEERKRAEQALRESEGRFRQVTEHITEVFFLVDLETGKTLYVSGMFEEIWGFPVEHAYANPSAWFDAIHRDDRPAMQASLEATRRGEPSTTTYRIVRPDGSICWIRGRASAVRDDAGRVYRLVGVAEDITHERDLEAQFRQAQKMEAVGRLAGGVAHDFNNLLTAISGYTDLVTEELRPDDPLRKDMDEIRKAAQRAAGLTRQLLAFSRQQVLAPRVLGLNTLVLGIEKMLHRLLGEDVELATVLNPDSGNVKADPGQLEQVIVNLAVNARDAMPEGGKLTIETAATDVQEHRGQELAEMPQGRYVLLAVSDTGTGMDENTQAKIFEPFFTTKEAGKGTGLGLSTVYGIVKQSGGFIWVYSEPGHGTTFKVYLPQVEEAAEVAQPTAVSPAPRGTEVVLLVEDEEAVRNLAHKALSRQGYEVLAAANGDEALSLCEQHASRIQLLVTDVVMPAMGGMELAQRLRQQCPDLAVLFISGYADRAVARHGHIEPDASYLEKPFTPASLARKVREMLDRAR